MLQFYILQLQILVEFLNVRICLNVCENIVVSVFLRSVRYLRPYGAVEQCKDSFASCPSLTDFGFDFSRETQTRNIVRNDKFHCINNLSLLAVDNSIKNAVSKLLRNFGVVCRVNRFCICCCPLCEFVFNYFVNYLVAFALVDRCDKVFSIFNFLFLERVKYFANFVHCLETVNFLVVD